MLWNAIFSYCFHHKLTVWIQYTRNIVCGTMTGREKYTNLEARKESHSGREHNMICLFYVFCIKIHGQTWGWLGAGTENWFHFDHILNFLAKAKTLATYFFLFCSVNKDNICNDKQKDGLVILHKRKD